MATMIPTGYHAKAGFGIGKLHPGIQGALRDREIGATDILSAERAVDRFERLELEVEVGFGVEFHGEIIDCLVKLS